MKIFLTFQEKLLNWKERRERERKRGKERGRERKRKRERNKEKWNIEKIVCTISFTCFIGNLWHSSQVIIKLL